MAESTVKLLHKKYESAESFPIYISIVIGVLACKTVYELSWVISAVYFKGYLNLSKAQKIEWNNRIMSTFHAIFIATVSLYFVFWSDLYSTNNLHGLITLRSSAISSFALGLSTGYFISDLAMIIWFYPSLGGMEYVVHHFLALMSLAYAMLSSEAQIYIFMVLISEATTPWINVRWYLDVVGMKSSRLYLYNGILIFLAWTVARIVLFLYMFYHIYLHYDQVKQMQTTGFVLMHGVPSIISVMNLVWFAKIFKGLKKMLAKRKTL